MMWLLVAREPRPDAPDWHGRRLLAAVDAVAWPLMWVLLLPHAPQPVGLIGPFFTALALLVGLGRLRRALWLNHRYWFTTWRWGKVLASMLHRAIKLYRVNPAQRSEPASRRWAYARSAPQADLQPGRQCRRECQQ